MPNPETDENPFARGYARLPRSWLDMGLSPGATALLAHLALAADAEGASWHSYRRLGERLGRSKATVCAYMRELIAAGIVETENLRCQNGSNWRVRATLTGWSLATRTSSHRTKDVAASLETTPCPQRRSDRIASPGHAQDRAVPSTERCGSLSTAIPVEQAERPTKTQLSQYPSIKRADDDQAIDDRIRPIDAGRRMAEEDRKAMGPASIHPAGAHPSSAARAIDAIWSQGNRRWEDVFGQNACFIHDQQLEALDSEARGRIAESEACLPRIPAEATIARRLQKTLEELGVTTIAEDALVTAITALLNNPDILEESMAALADKWPRHWRRLDHAGPVTEAIQHALAAHPEVAALGHWRRRLRGWAAIVRRRAEQRLKDRAVLMQRFGEGDTMKRGHPALPTTSPRMVPGPAHVGIRA